MMSTLTIAPDARRRCLPDGTAAFDVTLATACGRQYGTVAAASNTRPAVAYLLRVHRTHGGLDCGCCSDLERRYLEFEAMA